MGRIDAKQAWLGAMLVTGVGMGNAMAQAPQVSVADYERAASMLGDRTGPLVDHATSGIGWLDDGSLVYRERSNGVERVLRFDPATGKTAPAFNAQALADAMNPCGYYITAVKNGACVEPYPMLAWGVTMENVPHAATIAELAEQIGMDASALEATVTRYNELCEKGEDEDFGKPAEYMIPVEGETYYAFYMTPGSSVTFGGLQIDTDAHVLDANDQPISGLYAAGEVAFTGLFDAEYPCCGMAIGSAVYYGRVAAANAVAGK